MVGATSEYRGCCTNAYSSKEELLDSLGGDRSSARGINDKGQIVGQIRFTYTYGHAILWDGATVKDLGTLGGVNSLGAAINNSGQIVGWSDTLGGSTHATLWDNGAPIDLGTLGEHTVQPRQSMKPAK